MMASLAGFGGTLIGAVTQSEVRGLTTLRFSRTADRSGAYYLGVILPTVDATHTHLPARRTHTSIQRNLPLVSFPR